MDENLKRGINQFVKLTKKMGMLDNESLSEMVICMNYEAGHCDIVALRKDDLSTTNYDVCLDFPELPEDETDAMIDLAGFISVKLSSYLSSKKGGLKSSSKLSKEERVEKARSAAKARWAKK